MGINGKRMHRSLISVSSLLTEYIITIHKRKSSATFYNNTLMFNHFHETATGGRFSVHWSTSIQHAIIFTLTLHRMEDT